MAKKTLSKPVKVFAGTIGLFTLSCATIVAGPLLGFHYLEERSKEVKETVRKKQTSGTEIDTIKQLHAQMQKERFAVDRAAQLTAESRLNQYQNKAIRTLRVFAKSTDVDIQSYSFLDDPKAKKPAAKKKATPDASTKSAESSGTKQKTVTLKTSTVLIQMNAATKYTNILRFMNLIERNPTQMQIKKITLSGATEAKGSSADKKEGDKKDAAVNRFYAPYVTLDSLEIEVYTR